MSKELKQYIDSVAYEQSFGASIAINLQKTIVAISSNVQSYSHMVLINPVTQKQLIDPINSANMSITPFFSTDGQLLYVSYSGPAGGPGKIDLRETANGLPITSFKDTSGPFAWRPDGRRLFDAAEEFGRPRQYDLLGTDGPVPLWVADLAEGVSGLRLNEANVIEPLSPEEQAQRISIARTAISTADKDNRWAEFGSWYLSDDTDPQLSPYSELRESQLAALPR